MRLLVSGRKVKAAANSMHQFCPAVRAIFRREVNDIVVEAATLVLYVRNDAVRIVSDGSNWHVISDQLRPHVAKMAATASQTAPENTRIKLVFQVEEYDVGDIADVANSRFVIRRSGTYVVHAWWWGHSLNPAIGLFAWIYKNGAVAEHSQVHCVGTGYTLTCLASGVLDLSAGDSIEFQIQINGQSTSTGTEDWNRPRMTVTEIRP